MLFNFQWYCHQQQLVVSVINVYNHVWCLRNISLPSDGGPRIHSLLSWLSWRNGIMFWIHGMFDGKPQMLFFLCTTTISPFHIFWYFCSFMLENKIKLIPQLTLSPFATFQTLFSPLNRPYTNLTSKLKRRIRLSSFQNTPGI